MAKKSVKAWQEEDLFDAAPDFDPEDEDLENTRDFYKSHSHQEEYGDDKEITSGSSRLRAHTAALPSMKSGRYAGVVSSRKKLQDGGDEGSVSGDEEDEDDEAVSEVDESEDDGQLYSFSENDDDSVVGEAEASMGSDTEDESDDDNEDNEGEDEQVVSNTKPPQLVSADDDVKKGKAVKHQMGIWESMLEMRIQLQPLLLASNRLPSFLKMPVYCQHADTRNAVGTAKAGVRNMLVSLLDLQRQLLEQNPEMRHLAVATTGASSASDVSTADSRAQPNVVDSDEEIDSDLASGDDSDNDDLMKMLDNNGESEVEGEDGSGDDKDDESDGSGEDATNAENSTGHGRRKRRKMSKSQALKASADFERVLGGFQESFRPYRDQVLNKWSERTRLASGKLTSKSFSNKDNSIVTAINQVLTDRDRLVRRTQLNRSHELPIGETQPVASAESKSHDSHLKAYNPEIFDDEDFYHQMLKEFIEGRTKVADENDHVAMGRQWLQIQKLRRKVKKNVDTKASKGRKIRYDVHPKLVNFMAPITGLHMQDIDTDDIFSALFGKRRHD